MNDTPSSELKPLEVIKAFEDQVRLLRADVENLTNISLKKDEATKLRRDLDATLNSVKRAVVENEETTRGYSQAVVQVTRKAASDAASSAIKDMQSEVTKTAKDLSDAAGEARAEAWRYFGGFWVWLGCVGLASLIAGLMLGIWFKSDITTTRFAEDIPKLCDKVGGNLGKQDNGREYCVFWLE